MLLPSSYLSKSFLLNSRIGLNPLAILILPAFSSRLRTSTVRYPLEYNKLIDKIKLPIKRIIMNSFCWGQMLFERFPAFSGFLKLLILIHQVSQQSLGNKGHVRHKVFLPSRYRQIFDSNTIEHSRPRLIVRLLCHCPHHSV